MNIEGIAALVAAGVAAATLPINVVVGRWQLRVGREAAQAGVTQAEASYRAALDAVRAQSLNEHSQWHRNIRRDTYSSFLHAVTRYTQQAGVIPRLSATDPDAVPAALEASNALYDEVARIRQVIKLEGPDMVSRAAQALHGAALDFVGQHRDMVRRTLAESALNQAAERHPATVSRIRELLPVAAEWWSDTVSAPTAPTRESTEAERTIVELRGLFDSIRVSRAHIAPLCRAFPSFMNSERRYTEKTEAFIDKAREALHPPSEPPP